MSQAELKYNEILNDLRQFCANVTKKLKDPNLQIQLKMNANSEKFSVFFSQAGHDYRVRIAFALQKEIRTFLKVFTLQRFRRLIQKVQPFSFVQQLCDLWENYQRFVYAVKFFSRESQNSFKGFYKIANKFDSILANQQAMDKIDKNYKNEVVYLPVMAVNQLRQFLINEKLLESLISNFQKIFCSFMKQERQGVNTPQQKINDVLGFFQSIHLDFECDCVRKDQKLRIVKSANQGNVPPDRKSTADAFFDKTFAKTIFQDAENYYVIWVDSKGKNLQAAEQIRQILNFLEKQQSRAKFYIHDPKNQVKYLESVENKLIQHRLQDRLRKQNGLANFLTAYQLGKPEMVEQITNFWKVYKRVYYKQNCCKKIVLQIYNNYLLQQAKNLSQFAEKATQFIDQCIRLNKKNIQLVRMLGNVLQFDRIRVEALQNLVGMKYTNNDKIKYFLGAKHWAAYLHSRFKTKYAKTQKFNEGDADLLNLLKIVICKAAVIQQHHKFLNQRLTEDLDMSLQAHYTNAIQLQQKVLDQLKRQSSQNDVKSIHGCLRDIQTSLDLRSKLKSSQSMKPFNYFNQIIRKTGNFWADTSKYQILPPTVINNCLTAIREQLREQNLVFQLQNGTSLFTAKIKGQDYKFQLKNLYLMILMLIDQKPRKKMSFTDLARKQVRPLGAAGGKAELQLVRALVEMCEFKILKCNRQITQQNPNIQNWSPADEFSINQDFVPAKKLQIYRVMALPEYLKKAFNKKFFTIDADEKNTEKNRKIKVQGDCVKLLKHAQTLSNGQGTITFDELLKGQKRENNVDAKYLKQIIEQLIQGDLCVRVEEKKNTFKYKS